jgi:hypothetical protein
MCFVHSATTGVPTAALLIDANVSNTANINGSKLLAASVGTTQLTNLSVTAAKIANSTITTTQISATANITGTQLSASANILGSQLASQTVTNGRIALGAITQSNMGFTTAQNGNKIFDSSLNQGLYIKGLATTTQNGTSLGIFSSSN